MVARLGTEPTSGPGRLYTPVTATRRQTAWTVDCYAAGPNTARGLIDDNSDVAAYMRSYLAIRSSGMKPFRMQTVDLRITYPRPVRMAALCRHG